MVDSWVLFLFGRKLPSPLAFPPARVCRRLMRVLLADWRKTRARVKHTRFTTGVRVDDPKTNFPFISHEILSTTILFLFFFFSLFASFFPEMAAQAGERPFCFGRNGRRLARREVHAHLLNIRLLQFHEQKF